MDVSFIFPAYDCIFSAYYSIFSADLSRKSLCGYFFCIFCKNIPSTCELCSHNKIKGEAEREGESAGLVADVHISTALVCGAPTHIVRMCAQHEWE